MINRAIAEQDPEDLESLFDSIVAASHQEDAAGATGTTVDINPADKVINQIGHMTRALHDSLRELGYDHALDKVAACIPDARDRLNYVANLTEQAAERVLNATEAAQPVIEQMEIDSQRLAREWQKLFNNQLDVDQFKTLAIQTHAFLNDVPRQTKITNAYLMEIMMAQDFQDLTGQVIKKTVMVIQQVEKQLVDLLIENPPSTSVNNSYVRLLSGPVVNPARHPDVMASQDEVDDLLESLGF
jgi:chemotaxis protein CheZ